MQWVLVALIVAVTILGLAWYLTRHFRDEIVAVSDHLEADDAGDVPDSASIPLRTRAASISTTGKVMFGSIAALFIYIAIIAFMTFRTGSPSEFLYTERMEQGALVLGGAVVGVVAKNIAERNEGTLYVTTEDDGGSVRTVEEVPVDVQAVDGDSDGHALVTEYKRRRILGLFRRHKHVGEDMELRATNRPQEKTIQHQLPDTATELSDGTWHIRTQGRDPVSSPGEKADYIYRPPIEMEYADYVDREETNRRLRIRIKYMQARLSAITTEANRLRRKLKSGKYKEEEQIKGQIEDLVEMLTEALHGPGGGGFDSGQQTPPDGPRGHVTIDTSGSDNGQEARTDGGGDA